MDKLFVKAEINREDKKLVAVASTDVEDRHGEVITVTGWDVKNFKKNPVMLWAHNHDEPAIGIAKNLKKDMSFEPVFHDKTDMARAIKALYEGYVDEEGTEIPPVLNSFSVGFRALEMDGNTYTKQELLEISAVNVPANPEARVMAYKGLEKMGIQKDVIEKLEISTTDGSLPSNFPEEEKPEDKPEEKPEEAPTVEDLEERIEEQARQIQDLVKGLKHLNPSVDRKEAIVTRLTLQKVIARSTDRLLEGKPQGQSASLLKVVKRASDKLINESKQELKKNGKN